MGRTPLVVVTDRRQAAEAGHGLVDVVAAAVEAGARWVLLREKDLPAAERRRLALDIVAMLAPAGGRLIVASDAALAADIGAAGVHLSTTDPWPPSAVEGEVERRRPTDGMSPASRDRPGRAPAVAGDSTPAPAGPAAESGWVVGRSCHGVDELREARREGASYATLSPVFASPSKPGYGPALGFDGLAAACSAVPDLPIVALAGVGPGRAADCIAAGAHGVAVMGEVMRAPDPAAVVRTLLTELASSPDAFETDVTGAEAGLDAPRPSESHRLAGPAGLTELAGRAVRQGQA